MSSEALERAEALLAVEPGSNVKSAAWWFAAARDMAREVAKLEAALAVAREREQRAEVEADTFRNAAQFHARKRRETQEALADLLDTMERGDEYKAFERMTAARAAPVDEPAAATSSAWSAGSDFAHPAAATLAEPGDVAEAPNAHTAVASRGAAPSPGSASAAADEPGETPKEYPLDNTIVGNSTITYGDLRRGGVSPSGKERGE